MFSDQDFFLAEPDKIFILLVSLGIETIGVPQRG